MAIQSVNVSLRLSKDSLSYFRSSPHAQLYIFLSIPLLSGQSV